jgi:cold shock CspA family protein
MRGKMLWFNEVKDLGVVVTDEGDRLSVRGSGFAGGERPRGRCAEAVVTFEISASGGGEEAEDVVFVKEASPRRARLRGRPVRR